MTIKTCHHSFLFGDIPNAFDMQSHNIVMNGHKFVDLGFPSGLKWAICNVGANTPEEDGCYFAWGETEPKRYYGWNSYKWYDDNPFSYNKYNRRSGKTMLDDEDDAATQSWGDGCRMPTVDEFEELLNNTTSEWTTMYGVKGSKFTSKHNSSFVFFPASGYRFAGLYFHGSLGQYWSSSCEGYGEYALNLHFRSDDCSMWSDNRCIGHTVRAVCP